MEETQNKTKLIDIYKKLDSINIPEKEQEITEIKQKIETLISEINSLESSSLEKLEERREDMNVILPCEKKTPLIYEKGKMNKDEKSKFTFQLCYSITLILLLVILIVMCGLVLYKN